jgi:hypothetical protein
VKLIRRFDYMVVWDQTAKLFDLQGRFIAEIEDAFFDILGAEDPEGNQYIVLYWEYGRSTVIEVVKHKNDALPYTINLWEIELRKTNDGYLYYRYCEPIKLKIVE